MPKIDIAHKQYLTHEILEETYVREIFYGTLIFQQSSMIVLAAMLESNSGGQNYSFLISC